MYSAATDGRGEDRRHLERTKHAARRRRRTLLAKLGYTGFSPFHQMAATALLLNNVILGEEREGCLENAGMLQCSVDAVGFINLVLEGE